MSEMTFDRLDHDGIAELLKSAALGAAVHGLAEEIARNIAIPDPDAEIVVEDYVTDRVATSITVRDPRAAMWQARDGLLTQAAAATGAEVRAR